MAGEQVQPSSSKDFLSDKVERGQSLVGSREDVRHATLHGSLEVTRGGSKVAWANCDDGAKGVGNLQADGLRCGRVTKNGDEMGWDRGIPQYVVVPIHAVCNVERGQSRLLFVYPFYQLVQSPGGRI